MADETSAISRRLEPVVAYAERREKFTGVGWCVMRIKEGTQEYDEGYRYRAVPLTDREKFL